MSLTYSNPRKSFTTDSWPYGSKRTTATFTIETGKKGERASRVTVNPKTGRINKPKTTTYSDKAMIVDGSDGRTYIAELSLWGSVTIRKSDLHMQHEYISDTSENYAEVLALFN